MVVGVPESGIDAAIGYSEESGIPYEKGYCEEQLHRQNLHKAKSEGTNEKRKN